MADNMMRIAGRGADGTAKAIATDNSGNMSALITKHKTLETTHFTNKDADGYGTTATVEGMASIVMQASGTFVANIRLYGSLDNSTWTQIELFPASGGRAASACINTVDSLGAVAAAGFYTANIAGYKYVRPRISGYVSGAVSIVSVASTADAGITQSVAYSGGRINLLYEGLGVEIANGGSTPLTIDNYDCPFLIFSAVCNSAHNFNIKTIARAVYQTQGTSLDAGAIVADSGGTKYAHSGWVEAKSIRTFIYLYNLSDAAKTYDLRIFGVR